MKINFSNDERSLSNAASVELSVTEVLKLAGKFLQYIRADFEDEEDSECPESEEPEIRTFGDALNLIFGALRSSDEDEEEDSCECSESGAKKAEPEDEKAQSVKSERKPQEDASVRITKPKAEPDSRTEKIQRFINAPELSRDEMMHVQHLRELNVIGVLQQEMDSCLTVYGKEIIQYLDTEIDYRRDNELRSLDHLIEAEARAAIYQ